MIKYVRVSLTEGERFIVETLAEKRQKIDEENGYTNRRVGDGDDLEIAINGYGAEFAVAKALNLYPDLSIYPRRGSADLMYFQNSPVDVKSTVLQTGNLICAIHKVPQDVKYFILVRGTMPDYVIVGWCHAHELLNEKMIKKLKVDTFVVPADQLSGFDERQIYFNLINNERGGYKNV